MNRLIRKKMSYLLSTKSTIKLTSIYTLSTLKYGDRGGLMVKVLCYKSKGHWFDPNWRHENFSLT